VPSRRRDAICSSVAVPMRVSSSFVHAGMATPQGDGYGE
jgi:hypothetical protein